MRIVAALVPVLLLSAAGFSKDACAAPTAVTCDREIDRRDGKGGFKNNPANKKKTLKIIYPKQMSQKIADVKAYSENELFDSFRLGGSEWGGRERYYGGKPVEMYPANLLVVARLKDGRNFCVTLPKPQQVYD